ncbi:MAG: hypothetical protein CMF46_00840 [Legionellales bacterium]|nr:hypothetical protein [Legionellales bacterium]
MPTDVLEKKSVAKQRATRLKLCRDMTGLSRDLFDKRYGIPRGTIQNWESARFGGLTSKGANNIIRAFHAEGVMVSSQWLLHGLGHSPKFTDNPISPVEPERLQHNINHPDQDNIVSELLFFKKNNPDPIEYLLPDDSMHPVYVCGSYVAGNRLYQHQIDQAIGNICIIQTFHLGHIVRLLKAGSQPGLYHLLALNVHSQRDKLFEYDVEILSAAPIIWYRKTKKSLLDNH